MTDRDPTTHSRERFGARAQRYVDSKIHSVGDDLDRLVEIASPEGDWQVLDVATGGGHTALRFAPLVAHVIASDITPSMLDAAQAFIASKGVENVSFQLADASDLPFEDGRFDLVTCRVAPHHFADAAGFVREAARVLAPGGMLLVQDHVVPNDADEIAYIEAFEKLRDPSHFRAFSEPEWRAMFRDAGLVVQRTEEIQKTQRFASWVEIQDCSPETVQRLANMLRHAPPNLAARLNPQLLGEPEATFQSWHVIISGAKPRSDAPA